MKKIFMLFMTMVAISILGTAYADELSAVKGTMNDPDSLINLLDPSNAPKARIVKETVAGTATGGMLENPDSLIYLLDPSNSPKARIVKGTAAVGKPDNPDSLIYLLDPSNSPKTRI